MPDTHLLVLIHGMWGNPEHLAELHRVIEEVKVGSTPEDTDGIRIEVLRAETNSDESTYDGIDWGGERVAEEVRVDSSFPVFLRLLNIPPRYMKRWKE
jgi:hypothetical protein